MLNSKINILQQKKKLNKMFKRKFCLLIAKIKFKSNKLLDKRENKKQNKKE